MARNANHVTDHNELVALLDEQAARFGYTKVSGGPFSENDPAHIDQHNLMVTDLQGLATLAGRSFTTELPPVANRGDAGHPKDHDAIRAALGEVAGWAAWNAASGGLEESKANYNGTGQRWMVHTFTGNGTLVVTRATQEFRYLVVAGGNGANYYAGTYANGGEVLEGTSTLGANSYSVTVGAGGSGGQTNATSGGVSIFGPFTAAAGRTTTQVQSDISGVAHTGYGGNGNNPIAKGRGGVGQANSGTAGQPGAVIVAYRIS